MACRVHAFLGFCEAVKREFCSRFYKTLATRTLCREPDKLRQAVELLVKGLVELVKLAEPVG